MIYLDWLKAQFARRAELGRKACRRIDAMEDKHFENPARRDGRGRKSADLRVAEKTYKHLNYATDWRDRLDLDVNVRQAARALVTTAGHAQVPFEVLIVQASKLRGRVNASGKARNARQPVEDCEPLRIDLGSGYSVVRQHTTGMLGSLGGELSNCAKDNGWGLHDALRHRESDFYAVRRDDRAIAMAQVDLAQGRITEFLGRRNSDVRLPRRILLAMLCELDLNGDDVEACLQQGAVSIFASGRANLLKPDYCNRRGDVRVWCAKRHLVVKEGKLTGGVTRQGKRVTIRLSWHGGWSSFRWDGSGWASSPASRRDRLDGLMTRHPRIAVLAQQVQRRRLVVRRR